MILFVVNYIYNLMSSQEQSSPLWGFRGHLRVIEIPPGRPCQCCWQVKGDKERQPNGANGSYSSSTLSLSSPSASTPQRFTISKCLSYDCYSSYILHCQNFIGAIWHVMWLLTLKTKKGTSKKNKEGKKPTKNILYIEHNNFFSFLIDLSTCNIFIIQRL